jgi:ribosomal protein S18 acetylase RimI-like enzyme
MVFKIKSAKIQDKDNILSVIGSHRFKWDKPIAKKYYDDFFQSKSAFSKRDKVYVCVDGEEVIGVIGYCLDYYETNNYWLGWFYIHKKYEGKGYGKKLLEYIIKKLQGKRVRKLFVNTSSNKFYLRALKMYLKYGFKEEAVIRDYYEDGENQIILSKTIA